MSVNSVSVSFEWDMVRSGGVKDAPPEDWKEVTHEFPRWKFPERTRSFLGNQVCGQLTEEEVETFIEEELLWLLSDKLIPNILERDGEDPETFPDVLWVRFRGIVYRGDLSHEYYLCTSVGREHRVPAEER